MIGGGTEPAGLLRAAGSEGRFRPVLVDVLDDLSEGNPVVEVGLKLLGPRHDADPVKLIGR